MGKQLISRKQFAELCGVSAAAVTKACARALLPACDGKRIDLNHESAQKYLADKTAPPPPEPKITGIDGLYEEAIAYCGQTGRWSISNIQRGLKVGYERAKRMYKLMESTGLVPDDPKPATPVAGQPVPEARPHKRGGAAARETKKQQAWAADEQENEIFEIPADIQAFADMTLRELIERFGTDTRFIDWLSATQKIEAINEKRLKNAETEGKLISRALVKTGVIDRVDGVFVRMLSDGAKTIAARAHSMAQAGADVTEVRGMVEDQLGSFIRPAKVKMHEAVGSAPD